MGKKEGQRWHPCRCPLAPGPKSSSPSPSIFTTLWRATTPFHWGRNWGPERAYIHTGGTKAEFKPRSAWFQVKRTHPSRVDTWADTHSSRHNLPHDPQGWPPNTRGGSAMAPRTQPASGSWDRRLPRPRGLCNETHFSFQQIFIEHLVKALLGIRWWKRQDPWSLSKRHAGREILLQSKRYPKKLC